MLKLTDIRKKLNFNKNIGLSVFSIADAIKHPEDYRIDFDVYLPTIGKNLQRPFVWTLLQKQELIMSMLKGLNIPVLSLIQYTEVENGHDRRRDRVYQVIDGKQRLSTMISFVKGEFPITFNGQDYYFSDLDDKAKYEVEHYWVKADVAYSYKYTDGDESAFITDQQKIDWFEMINFAGTPQDTEHLNNLKSK